MLLEVSSEYSLCDSREALWLLLFDCLGFLKTEKDHEQNEWFKWKIC